MKAISWSTALFAIAVLLDCQALAGDKDAIRSAGDLYRAVYVASEIGRAFDICATATTRELDTFARIACEDGTGATVLFLDEIRRPVPKIEPGDRFRAKGTIGVGKRSRNPYAECLEMEVLSHGAAPLPQDASAEAILSGSLDCRLMRMTGMVRDVFHDEIDPGYNYMVFVSGGNVVYVPMELCEASYEQLDSLVGLDVAVTGFAIPFEFTARKRMGRIFFTSDGLNSLKRLSSAATDAYDVPDIATLFDTPPQKIALLGRHRVQGRVIAKWNAANILVKTASGQIADIALSSDKTPEYGDTIEAVGFPESDLYRINLSRAIWRKAATEVSCDETPRDIAVREMLSDPQGRQRFDPFSHGSAVQMAGTVVSLPAIGNNDGRLTLKSGDYLVPVDFSSCPEALSNLEAGCELKVAGTCVMESDNWRASAAFPRIRGFVIVIRTPSDVTIMSRPSWWTPRRLLAVIGSLTFVLFGILVWNAILRRLVERRGRQLFKAQIAQASASLKVEERTRLAVELHDALSQNLTGASMQIDAARKLLHTNLEKTALRLDIASSTLESSREELRNCIWDLRSQSLEEPDMDSAIRKALERHLGDTHLSVRFNIPRSRLSDNTAHALLCIIRELATNAVRHGHATEIKVGGALESGKLLFFVKDNGCGFSPETAVGRNQGHFGLQGVRERLKQMNGSIVITSVLGRETKATATIALTTQQTGSRA